MIHWSKVFDQGANEVGAIIGDVQNVDEARLVQEDFDPWRGRRLLKNLFRRGQCSCRAWGTHFTPSNVAPACDKLLAAAAHGCYTGIRRSESVPLFNGSYE